jgi:DNA-binding CsgD family transcriptional regulator
MGDETGTQHPLPDLFTKTEWDALGRLLNLSARQLEIARWMCLGYRTDEIAKRLDVKSETIRLHRRKLYGRLAVPDRIGVPVRLVVASRQL